LTDSSSFSSDATALKTSSATAPPHANECQNGFEGLAADWMPYVSRCIRVGGHCLAYLDEGLDEGVSGDADQRTILCVHGNPTWSFYYRRVIERFAPSYRVVAVDHLGCGRSDKPAKDQFAYTMAAHRDNLIAVIDQLDLKNVVLLAHDWGGAIGLSAAHACRDRFAGIVLLNTAAFPPPYMPRRIAACRWPVVGTPAVRGLNLFAKAAITMAMSRTKLSSQAAAGLLAPYDCWANRVAIDRFVRDIPLSPDHPTHATLAELEAGLSDFGQLPIQLIWGMKDWCFRPECLRRFQAAWPHANTLELATTGHYVMEDSPEETLDTMETFLSSIQ
jgi:haloalkane dehalogenase